MSGDTVGPIVILQLIELRGFDVSIIRSPYLTRQVVEDPSAVRPLMDGKLLVAIP